MALIKQFRIKSYKNPNPIISFEDVSLSYGNRLILDNISFKINEGEIFGMLGPNGVGKSTIFNLITGLLKPDYGDIEINQKKVTDIPIYKRALDFGVAIVPQTGGVFANLSCSQNLKAISEIVIDDKNQRNFKIENMISKFQLEPVKDIKAKFLSGGQRKRLSIAMSLLSDPKIILMDEPFQGLDIMSTRELQETIVKLQTEENTRSCIISDHAARDLLAISDRAIVLANKKIAAIGKPSEILQNEDAKSAYFGDSFKIN